MAGVTVRMPDTSASGSVRCNTLNARGRMGPPRENVVVRRLIARWVRQDIRQCSVGGPVDHNPGGAVVIVTDHQYRGLLKGALGAGGGHEKRPLQTAGGSRRLGDGRTCTDPDNENRRDHASITAERVMEDHGKTHCDEAGPIAPRSVSER